MHKICSQKLSFEIIFLKIFIHLPGDNELNRQESDYQLKCSYLHANTRFQYMYMVTNDKK